MGIKVKAMIAIAIGEILVGCVKKMVKEIQEPKQPKEEPEKIDPATDMTINRISE